LFSETWEFTKCFWTWILDKRCRHYILGLFQGLALCCEISVNFGTLFKM
jgi:hypothetical protein